MACPFFMPVQKLDQPLWIHPTRLPLGAGWQGYCNAPGHEGAIPTHDELANGCNVGYAVACPRLPRERACDAVRFSIARDLGSRILVAFACEAAHRPAGHGVLEYSTEQARWTAAHADPPLQKMAECYLESYLVRRIRPAETGRAASVNS